MQNGENIRDIKHTVRRSDGYLMVHRERRKNGNEDIFAETIVENFLKIMKDTNLEIESPMQRKGKEKELYVTS
jgi:hypothetical protein